MYVAIEGCAHGHLNLIYDSLAQIEASQGIRVDLLIITGDFQATRNADDLECMAVPDKYRRIGDFPEYYSGQRVAPVLTLFIGGNHEASNHLWELYYGGWVAPNIYFLGASGVVDFAGIRIAGVSGIYKHGHHMRPYTERVPYNRDTERSVYHMRQFEVNKLACLTPESVDIVVSHDWPLGVTDHGDVATLIKYKPYFESDISQGRLGNPLLMPLLQKLRPKYWFSSHLHCKFSALVPHSDTGGKTGTKFLALDKPVPNRHFLQVITFPSVPVGQPRTLRYDLEWLAIISMTHESVRQAPWKPIHLTGREIEQQKRQIVERFPGHDLTVPLNFLADVPCGAVGSRRASSRFLAQDNHQTAELLGKLCLHNHFQEAPPSKVHPYGSRREKQGLPVNAEAVLDSATQRLQGLQARLQGLEQNYPSSGPTLPPRSSRAVQQAPREVVVAELSQDDDDDDEIVVFTCTCKGPCTCSGK